MCNRVALLCFVCLHILITATTCVSSTPTGVQKTPPCGWAIYTRQQFHRAQSKMCYPLHPFSTAVRYTPATPISPSPPLHPLPPWFTRALWCLIALWTLHAGTRFTSIMSASAQHYETTVRVDPASPSTWQQPQSRRQQADDDAVWLQDRVESARYLLKAILNHTVNGIPELDAVLNKLLQG